MKIKHKTFDCVEMKHKCQQRMRDEYESRKEEFTSYTDFINRKAEESQLWETMQNKIARAHTKAVS